MKIVIENKNTCLAAPKEIILKVKRSSKLLSILKFISNTYLIPLDKLKILSNSNPLPEDFSASLLKNLNLELFIEYPKDLFESAIQAIENNKNNALLDVMITACSIGWNISLLTDEKGWGLIHYSCFYNSTFILKNLCVENEKSINWITKDGWTPLIICAYNGCLHSLKTLLEYKKININLVTSQDTALHKAVESKNPEIVQILMEKGANIETENFSKKTCIEVPTSEEILTLIPLIRGNMVISQRFDINSDYFIWQATIVNQKFSFNRKCTLVVDMTLGKFLQFSAKFQKNDAETPIFKKKLIRLLKIEGGLSSSKKKFDFSIFFPQVSLKYYVDKEEKREEILSILKKTSDFCKWKEIGIRPSYERKSFNVLEFDIKDDNCPVQESIKLNEFERIKVIGEGSFGTVYLIMHKHTRELFALKSSIRESDIRNTRMKYAIIECEILKKVNHPFIVRLFWSLATKKHLHLILEYCSRGDLAQFMKKKEPFSDKDCRFLLGCVALGLQYLHHNNIICRDLKPANILIDSYGYLKICDFGLAQNRIQGEKMNAKLVGSPNFLAPEGILTEKVGKKSEIWTFGIIAYQLHAGCLPFKAEDVNDLYNQITSKEITYPNFLCFSSKSFIKFLLNRDPAKRPSIDEVMKHEYFESIDWNTLLNKKYEAPEFLIRN